MSKSPTSFSPSAVEGERVPNPPADVRWRRTAMPEGGQRAAFAIVLHSMWRRAEGKFALIVLASWLLIAIVSLFWTPQSLWATDGYHVWAKPSAAH